MPDNYKIQVKLGNAEFLAEGPESAVKDAFEQFMRAREATAPVIPNNTNDVTPPGSDAPRTEIEQSLLDRVFQKDDDIVSLRVLPQKTGATWQADAVIMLLYGFRRLVNMPEVLVTKLNQGLRKSGINLDRVDNIIKVHNNLYMKGGVRSGGRYTLNNQGISTAERWLKEHFS